MAVNPVPVFDDFEAKIKAVVAPLQVFDAEVPDDKHIPMQDGKMVPFVAMFTGGPIRSGRGHHIVSNKYDTTILFFTVQVYAPRSDIARTYKGRIVELAGTRLVDSGELTLAGGNTFSRASNEVRPTMYVEEVQFTVRSNLSWE